jgi:hypothetical protein
LSGGDIDGEAIILNCQHSAFRDAKPGGRGAVERRAKPVEVVIKARPFSPDPKDDMILDLAINGQAEALVTSYTKHFARVGKSFGIPRLSPAELFEKMRKGNEDGD